MPHSRARRLLSFSPRPFVAPPPPRMVAKPELLHSLAAAVDHLTGEEEGLAGLPAADGERAAPAKPFRRPRGFKE